MATLSDFRTRVPLPVSAEFDAMITTELSDTATLVDFARCTSNPTAAHVYLTAHNLSMGVGALAEALGGYKAGPVTSMKMGEIGASFGGIGAQSPDPEGYGRTPWGQKFRGYLYTHAGLIG